MIGERDEKMVRDAVGRCSRLQRVDSQGKCEQQQNCCHLAGSSQQYSGKMFCNNYHLFRCMIRMGGKVQSDNRFSASRNSLHFEHRHWQSPLSTSALQNSRIHDRRLVVCFFFLTIGRERYMKVSNLTDFVSHVRHRSVLRS